MADSKYEVKIFASLVIAAAVFFAFLLFRPQPEEKKPTIQIKMVDLSEFRSLPMINVANLCFVQLEVNGTTGDFLIDTGAEESVFNLNYLDSLHVAMTDTIPLPNSKIFITDTLSISAKNDTLFAFQKRFYAYPLTKFNDKIIALDSTFKKQMFFGILGQDLMRQEGMIINFQNNNIYLTNKYNRIK